MPASRKDYYDINPLCDVVISFESFVVIFFNTKDTKDYTKKHKGIPEKIIISLKTG
jgi:hypothetical protein